MRRNGRHGGVVGGIILAVMVVSVLAVITLVGTGFYVADRVRVTERAGGGDTTIETPFGSLHVRDNVRLDPHQLGVPIYPGAVRDSDSREHASFRLDIGDVHKSFAVSAASYHTRDSIDRVTDFYRGELPHWLISTKDDGRVQLSFTKHGYKRFVAISEDDGETRIALASVGEPASN